MTQEEKQLLLKDLCARLPYGVKGLIDGFGTVDFRGHANFIADDIAIEHNGDLSWIGVNYFKPYLRSMSSMTEEEKRVLNGFAFDMGNKWFDAASNEERWLATTENNIKSTDYLYSKYLDIHGLIEKGLALEAPDGMYKTE